MSLLASSNIDYTNRKYKITFEPIEHKYTIEGHENEEFLSVTTFIGGNYCDDNDFVMTPQMFDAISNCINRTLQEYQDKCKDDEEERSRFFKRVKNIRHLPRLIYLSSEQCARCNVNFSEEEITVEFPYDHEYDEYKHRNKKRRLENFPVHTKSVPIKKCPVCFNRFAKRICQSSKREPVDLFTMWQFSREDGTNLHAFIENYYNGVYNNEDDLLFAIHSTKGASSFMKFYKDAVPEFEVLKVELRVASMKYKIAGTIDALARINGKKHFVDWKCVKMIDETRKEYALHAPFNFLPSCKLSGYWLQLCTYAICEQEEFPSDEEKGGIIVCFDPLLETYRVFKMENFDSFYKFTESVYDYLHRANEHFQELAPKQDNEGVTETRLTLENITDEDKNYLLEKYNLSFPSLPPFKQRSIHFIEIANGHLSLKGKSIFHIDTDWSI